MHSPEGSSAPPPRFYGRARNRVRASVTDAMWYGGSLLVLLLAMELSHVSSAVGVPLFWGWVVAALLYEPVLVSWRGATISHSLANLHVVDASTGRPPSFVRAFARTWLKGIFGLPSFAFMALTRRHQALHDIMTGTLVEIADLTRARPDDVLVERPAEELIVAVPVWQRVLVIIGWQFVTATVFAVVLGALYIAACPDTRCPTPVRVADQLLSLAWMATGIGVLVLGWRGQLPGARD